jgi:hypothetical protein
VDGLHDAFGRTEMGGDSGAIGGYRDEKEAVRQIAKFFQIFYETEYSDPEWGLGFQGKPYIAGREFATVVGWKFVVPPGSTMSPAAVHGRPQGDCYAPAG